VVGNFGYCAACVRYYKEHGFQPEAGPRVALTAPRDPGYPSWPRAGPRVSHLPPYSPQPQPRICLVAPSRAWWQPRAVARACMCVQGQSEALGFPGRCARAGACLCALRASLHERAHAWAGPRIGGARMGMAGARAQIAPSEVRYTRRPPSVEPPAVPGKIVGHTSAPRARSCSLRGRGPPGMETHEETAPCDTRGVC
jgi:hypothetical protein